MRTYVNGAIEVAVLNGCWTGEWDLREGDIHNPIACTIDSREEAYQKLRAYCEEHPECCFLVFDTTGGVRAFLVSESMQPGQWESFRLHSKLDCDPLFQELCFKAKEFNARISKKQKYLDAGIDDYISKPRFRIGKGTPVPTLVKQVKTYAGLVANAR